MRRELEAIRDRQAEIRNDITALDRTLRAFGYTGDLDAIMPRQRNVVIFGRGELTRAILGELRLASEPLSTRDIARAVITLRGDDPRDRAMLTGIVRRASKALRVLKIEGAAKGAPDKSGNMFWTASRN